MLLVSRMTYEAMMPKCNCLQIACTQKVLAGKLFLALICPCYCLHRAINTRALCFALHLDVQTEELGLSQTPAEAQIPKCKCLRNSPTQNVLALNCFTTLICPWHSFQRLKRTGTPHLSCHLRDQTYALVS